MGDYLVGDVHDGGHAEAVRRFLELSDDLDAGSGDGGRSWARGDLYVERVAWPR